MTNSASNSTELGRFIRTHVIPTGMSVTEAARRLGVGRPALSNLLNGRAALSQDMALRLEGTFGADRTKLLGLQAESDQQRRHVEQRAVPVGTYAPSFLTIKARQIAEWAAENIQARELLPVLLRRLIHSTGRELRQVDFPGYDNAQRRGWDGWVETDAATPWVPEGKSGWEFGVAQRPGPKAEHDYRARLNTLSAKERAACTFVFVTPRKWEGRVQWVRGKEAAGDWKAVRAFDASDLEQWLETTIAPRIWLASELGIPTEGFHTLDHFWDRWAAASDPPMTAAVFAPSVAAHAGDLKKWLENDPGDHPFTVAADSKGEAVAFLACLLQHEDVPAHAHDGTFVFESASTLRTLAQSSAPIIPIVYSEEAEHEIVTLYRQRHCIVVRPRNAVDREPDVVVELLGHAAFEKALADMGVTERERVNRLASESGRSPTVLRRRLSKIPAIRTPPWAGDEAVARRLIPMALLGAWHNGSKADREVLAELARRDYDKVEESIAGLLRQNDCPVWSVDQYRGVVSKIDALFAIAPWMTEKDVVDFVKFAEYVLSESDPALDLPEYQRWAAGLYGKVREHSTALRTGICESLVMLSVHGNALFRNRLGVDIAAHVAALIKRLLTPFTSESLRSHDRDLPGYAEAAPNEFLSLLEEDLMRPGPALQGILNPTGASVFEHPARTGILWALERLAWSPQTFMRVVAILAKLSKNEIDDNWVNKPINSLVAILSPWIPQTAAPLEARIRALEMLCRQFPEVGWQICIKQFELFEGGKHVASVSARPRWRNYAAGAGWEVTGRERYEFARKALNLAISWPVHDRKTLGDLVDRLGVMSDEDSLSVWNCIDAWSGTETNEKARATLRENIRIMFLTRWGFFRGLKADQRVKAREIWEKLTPRDPIRRHSWLFSSEWVECSSDGFDEEDLDYEKREERVNQLRTEVMTKFWSAHGLDGALRLLSDCDAWTIGRYTAYCAVDQPAAADVLRACLSTNAALDEKLDDFMRGFLWFVEENLRATLICTVTETATVEQIVRLFKCAPFRDQTWRLLDRQHRSVQDRYWQVVAPAGARFTESETTQLVDKLLEVSRPREAYLAVRSNCDKVETSRLRRLLWAVANVNMEFTDDGETYVLSEALHSLDGRPGVTVDEMAQLEFTFVHALDRVERGIPNIERKIAESPGWFAQVVALACKREDDGQDPLEWRVEDSDRRTALGDTAYRLLTRIRRMPGVGAEGKVEAQALHQWVTEVRRFCGENGRTGVGDRWIGELLSRAPSEEDGSWPCRPVCEVLESIASGEIASGFEVGVYNARGAHWRGLDEGGKQERELSAKYRVWAQRLAFDYPFVAGIIETIAQGYDRDAEREDSEVQVMKRLEH